MNSGPFLPVRRIAAGMKTGNHDQGVILDDKKQRVRKPAQEGASNIFEDDGKLPRIFAHPFDQGIKRLAETPVQPGGFAFIPILRLDINSRAA
jgi:hypothetical protein